MHILPLWLFIILFIKSHIYWLNLFPFVSSVIWMLLIVLAVLSILLSPFTFSLVGMLSYASNILWGICCLDLSLGWPNSVQLIFVEALVVFALQEDGVAGVPFRPFLLLSAGWDNQAAVETLVIVDVLLGLRILLHFWFRIEVFLEECVVGIKSWECPN